MTHCLFVLFVCGCLFFASLIVRVPLCAGACLLQQLFSQQELIIWLWNHPYEFCQKALLSLNKNQQRGVREGEAVSKLRSGVSSSMAACNAASIS